MKKVFFLCFLLKPQVLSPGQVKMRDSLWQAFKIAKNHPGKIMLANVLAWANEFTRRNTHISFFGLRNFFSNRVVSQDLGKVLITLVKVIYVTNEKQKIIKEKYQPTVFLTTKKAGNNIVLTVKDNGNGIPQNIVDKIFQPFFTTKPTGQGTALGLSLSYDIVKAHGGEIKVESKEGEGSKFNIQLPFFK